MQEIYHEPDKLEAPFPGFPYLLPTCQVRGVGRRLVDLFLSRSNSSGSSRSWMCVSVEQNSEKSRNSEPKQMSTALGSYSLQCVPCVRIKRLLGCEKAQSGSKNARKRCRDRLCSEAGAGWGTGVGCGKVLISIVCGGLLVSQRKPWH